MSVIVLADKTPVARCEHRCEVCGGTIARGEKYRRQRNIFDGEPYVWKAHGLCDAAMSVLWRELRAEGYFDAEDGPEPEQARDLVARFFASLSTGLNARGQERDR